eukprot:403346424
MDSTEDLQTKQEQKEDEQIPLQNPSSQQLKEQTFDANHIFDSQSLFKMTNKQYSSERVISTVAQNHEGENKQNNNNKVYDFTKSGSDRQKTDTIQEKSQDSKTNAAQVDIGENIDELEEMNQSILENDNPNNDKYQQIQNSQSGLPSIIDKLRERAEQNLAQKHKQFEINQQNLNKKKKKFRHRIFKLRKDSKEAQEKVKKLTRKDKKQMKDEIKSLKRLTQRELQAYQMLQDPNNEFMRKIISGGEEGLQDLQRKELWQSIIKKKEAFGSDGLNDFLNHLTDDEFTEFISHRDIKLDDKVLNNTGKTSEDVRINGRLREQMIELAEEEAANEFKNKFMMNELEEMIDNQDVTNEFKVFKDPTFSDFIKIFGKTYNKDLPLYAQLYIIKEILGFYQFHTNQSLLSLIGLNILMNVGYYFFNYRYLFKRNTQFYSLPRVIIMFMITQILHDQLLVKQVLMNNYRVNINDLLDNEELLGEMYQNEHFRAIIKKITNEFEYLINPIFDVDEATQNVSKEVQQKYATPNDGYFPMNQGELMMMYAQTFNAPKSSRQVYSRMIQKYDEFFEQAKEKKSQEMTQILSGKKIHEAIRACIEFYDSLQQNKGKYEQSGNDQMIRQVKEAKSRVYSFIDGLIEVLHKDFDEQSVTIASSRREKVELLRKLCKELDPQYSDFNNFKKMLDERMTDIMKISIDKENEPYVPKSKLKYNEYLAIKNHFNPMDFERNSMLILGLPITSMALFLIQRVGRRMKWL